MDAITTQTSDYTFKILLIGESGVGKTALLERYCDDVFNESLLSTVGVDFKAKYVRVGGKTIKVQLWDPAGQEKFRNITTSYYRGTHGCLVVYDVTEKTTFEKIGYWLNELRSEKQQPEIMIVGNKTDRGTRAVSDEMVSTFLKENGVARARECSAKTGENVGDVFTELIGRIYGNKEIMSRMQTTSGSLAMEDVTVGDAKAGACC